MNEEEPTTSKDDYEVYCSTCNTSFSSTITYRQHIKSNKHLKAEKKQLMKQKYGKAYSEAFSKMKGEKAKTDGDDGRQDDSQDAQEGDEDTEVFPCEICQKICTGIENFKSHLDGKPHAKQIKKQKLLARLKSDPAFANSEALTSIGDKHQDELYAKCPQLKPFAYCEPCSKSFSGPEGYDQHLTSDAHKKMIEKLALVETIGNEIKNSSTASGDEMDRKLLATCKACNKDFYDPVPYHQHMSSVSHKKQLKKLQLLDKIKQQLLIENGQESQFKCLECAKVFNDPKVFYHHLVNSSHAKEKDESLKDLLQKFPNLLKDTKDDASMDSDPDTDEDDILTCSVCHKAFSGPESARDHFQSKKHLKTIKEKRRMKRIIEKQKAKLKSSTVKQATGEVLTEEHKKMPEVSVSTSVTDSDDFEVIS